jgi:hypothetical protein
MAFQKKSYLKPELTVHGNVEVLTKGSAIGNFTDRDFPAGTPRGELSFS